MAREHSKDKDLHCLREAEGWLELGRAVEALHELDRMSPAGSASLEALRTRYSALAATDQWNCALLVSEVAVSVFPGASETWLWRAHAVRALKGAANARDSLSPAGDRFPEDKILLLNLALYERELGNDPKATEWLVKIRHAAGNSCGMDAIRRLVEQDAHLLELWDSVEHAAVV